jgi:hypothetical protein
MNLRRDSWPRTPWLHSGEHSWVNSHERRGKPESIFDLVQGITAVARGKAHQDARRELEGRAKRLLERG